MNTPSISFQRQIVRIPLADILPVRRIPDQLSGISRYKAIVSSIQEVGLVEPLMVHPQKGHPARYLLMDGHLRYFALKELQRTDAECILTTEDESFTFNARINRLAPIQEHKMILKAVQNGVPPERIAAALSRDIHAVKSLLSLMVGVNEEAAELLKDKHITPAAIRVLKRVKGIRQIEMAELMISMNDFTLGYVEALVMGTPKEHLANPDKRKRKIRLSAEQLARLENEMVTLEQDFKAVEKTYGENVLCLTVCRNYVKKLIENPRIARFLKTRYADLINTFEEIAATEAL